MMTLLEIYHKYWTEDTKELLVQNTDGTLVYIDGYREEDPEGGCMATGTPACLLGRAHTEDGSRSGFWFDTPKGYSDCNAGWRLHTKFRKPIPYQTIQEHHIEKLKGDIRFWKGMFLLIGILALVAHLTGCTKEADLRLYTDCYEYSFEARDHADAGAAVFCGKVLGFRAENVEIIHCLIGTKEFEDIEVQVSMGSRAIYTPSCRKEP